MRFGILWRRKSNPPKMSISAFVGNLNFMKGNLHTKLEGYLWNLIDTHDTERFINCAQKDFRKQMLAASLQLLLPGMSMIYYGDEVGLEGGTDPDCRCGMLWDKSRQNQSLLQYYQTLIRIRHTCLALTKGSITEQYTEDEKGLFYITRHLGDQYITVIFHTKAGAEKLAELAGKQNLIKEQPFSRTLEAYETAVLV